MTYEYVDPRRVFFETRGHELVKVWEMQEATEARPANADLAEIKWKIDEAIGATGPENPWASITLTAEEAGALIAKVEELRAVLGPLLDDPYEGDTGTLYCRFCEATLGGSGDLAYSPRDEHRFVHEPNCPVLRADELLGRACR